eukprot:COSAG05_NODE_1287_length_5276_cov_10.526173_4_plen_165_part_00
MQHYVCQCTYLTAASSSSWKATVSGIIQTLIITRKAMSRSHRCRRSPSGCMVIPIQKCLRPGTHDITAYPPLTASERILAAVDVCCSISFCSCCSFHCFDKTPTFSSSPPLLAVIRVRVQLIRHLKTCTTEVYIQNECAHVGLSIHAPVGALRRPHSVPREARM